MKGKKTLSILLSIIMICTTCILPVQAAEVEQQTSKSTTENNAIIDDIPNVTNEDNTSVISEENSDLYYSDSVFADCAEVYPESEYKNESDSNILYESYSPITITNPKPIAKNEKTPYLSGESITWQLHVWIEDENGNVPSTVRIFDWVYLKYRIEDTNGNKLDPAWYGWNNYKASLYIYNGDGSLRHSYEYSNCTENYIGVLYNDPNNPTGTQRGKGSPFKEMKQK